eukprot:gnl/Spiro4/6599_TR3398_c0_g1_i1.p1 gnl/Spiro4/6599_TR3398_c0_g1~~gnl/Spiro4/6599_TR3398_c0_g1_i1.p1  ORF type:complete len:533 (+),score=121.10 gnl/Spiro4/6599_TR3398_c0_g1_i1:37-1599(+)
MKTERVPEHQPLSFFQTLYLAFPTLLVCLFVVVLAALFGYVPFWLPVVVLAITLYRIVRVPSWLADVPGPSFFEALRDTAKMTLNDRSVEYARRYGRVFRNFGFQWTLCISDTDLVKEVMTNTAQYEKLDPDFLFPEFSLNRRFFGPARHLVNANDHAWVRQSQAMRNTFAFDTLRSMYSTFQLVVGELFDRFSKAGGDDVDLYDSAQRFTLAVLGRSIFSVDFKTLGDTSSEYTELYNGIMKEIFAPFPLLRSVVFSFMDLLPTPGNTSLYSKISRFHVLINEILDARIKSMDHPGPPDMLDALVIAYKEGRVSKAEIFSNIMIFFLAGHDTTSTSLAVIMHHFAAHPEIQQRAYEEVRSVIGDKPFPTFEDTNKLDYINCIIKESLRIVPPVMVLPPRQTVAACELGGVHLPARAIVDVWINSVHHDPTLWPDPERFDPDRFAKGKEINNYAWIPFSEGTRRCIGLNFSLIEQRCLVASLLQRFEVLPPTGGCKPIRFANESILSHPIDMFAKLRPRH